MPLPRPFALLLALLLPFWAGLAAGCKTSPAAREDTPLREIPREQRVALMVMNFSNTSAADLAPRYASWEIGIPSMIMTDLESVGIFNLLSWDRLEDILEQQKLQALGMVPPEQAVRIGRLAAARFTLTGAFVVMGGQLRIEAKVFSVESGVQLGAGSVTGPVDRFFELEKRLAVQAVSWCGAVLTAEEAAALAGKVETRSVEASLRNYEGEKSVREANREKARGRAELAERLVAKARASFEEALREDAGYARAKVNLASLALAIPMTL